MKKIIKIISIAIITIYIFLFSVAAVFLAEPKGEPTYIEWEREKE